MTSKDAPCEPASIRCHGDHPPRASSVPLHKVTPTLRWPRSLLSPPLIYAAAETTLSTGHSDFRLVSGWDLRGRLEGGSGRDRERKKIICCSAMWHGKGMQFEHKREHNFRVKSFVNKKKHQTPNIAGICRFPAKVTNLAATSNAPSP